MTLGYARFGSYDSVGYVLTFDHTLALFVEMFIFNAHYHPILWSARWTICAHYVQSNARGRILMSHLAQLSLESTGPKSPITLEPQTHSSSHPPSKLSTSTSSSPPRELQYTQSNTRARAQKKKPKAVPHDREQKGCVRYQRISRYSNTFDDMRHFFH